jgi:hypothetical protein
LETLHRDTTEALLRLRLARSQRDRKETEVCEKRLDGLLERLSQAYASVKVG